MHCSGRERTCLTPTTGTATDAALTWVREPRWPPVLTESRQVAGYVSQKMSNTGWRVIEIPVPDRDARIELWQRACPGWSSLEPRDRERLADIPVTGGTIREAVKTATGRRKPDQIDSAELL